MLTRYLPNAAQHAQYLNGQSLYPGFELDQACAPLIALEHYLKVTGKRDLLQQPWLPAALSLVYETFSEHFDPQSGLFSTFLTPHDDPTGFPYLTYNNVLVWRALEILADLEIGATHYHTPRTCAPAAPASRKTQTDYPGKMRPTGTVRPAVRGGGGCVGDCDWNDLPGASWSLFPYYGFCSADDPLYLNSLQWIYSEHNPHYYPGPFGGVGAAHFPFPSCFDLANRLLRKDPAALEHDQTAQTGPWVGLRVVRPADGRGAHRRGLCYAGRVFGVYNGRELAMCKKESLVLASIGMGMCAIFLFIQGVIHPSGAATTAWKI